MQQAIATNSNSNTAVFIGDVLIYIYIQMI